MPEIAKMIDFCFVQMSLALPLISDYYNSIFLDVHMNYGSKYFSSQSCNKAFLVTLVISHLNNLRSLLF